MTLLPGTLILFSLLLYLSIPTSKKEKAFYLVINDVYSYLKMRGFIL